MAMEDAGRRLRLPGSLAPLGLASQAVAPWARPRPYRPLLWRCVACVALCGRCVGAPDTTRARRPSFVFDRGEKWVRSSVRPGWPLPMPRCLSVQGPQTQTPGQRRQAMHTRTLLHSRTVRGSACLFCRLPRIPVGASRSERAASRAPASGSGGSWVQFRPISRIIYCISET